MPPVTKAGGTAFRKDVAFVAKDEDQQVASGIVMVPDKADLQNDFAREETIRAFADQFETFAEAGQAGGGIMHAVWPDGWMGLERNEVLDEAEEIGGETVESGAWVQSWSVENGQLWELIDQNILEGYSIGAIQVDWDGPFEQDDVDVDTSEVPDDELVWELTDGIVREVSAVDIPAVPDAQILEAKALEKRLAEHVGNPDAFVEEAMERGHTEAEAERLWDVLNEAMEADGASEPGKQSMFARAGKAFLSALSGSGSDDGSEATDSPEDPDPTTAKEGRTLSASNRDSLFATIDASLDVLEDAGVDHGMTRFTDRDSVDFDLSEHDARTWEGDHGEDGGDGGQGEDEDEEEETENAAGGDTPDATTDMSDDDGGDKSLAEKNAEQIDELTDAVKGLAEAVDGDGGDDQPPDGEKTAEVELPNGDIAEVSKAEALSWFEGDDGGDPETTEAAATKADIEALHARLDSITRQSGVGSDQIRDDGGSDEESGLDEIGKALS